MAYKKKSSQYGRVIVLIDAANIIYANKYLRWSIDHQKFQGLPIKKANCDVELTTDALRNVSKCIEDIKSFLLIFVKLWIFTKKSLS